MYSKMPTEKYLRGLGGQLMCVLEIFCSAVNLRTMNLKDGKLFARCIFVLVSLHWLQWARKGFKFL